MAKYLFDTSIIIGYWRGKGPQFKQWVDDALDGRIDAGISLLTDMELWTQEMKTLGGSSWLMLAAG